MSDWLIILEVANVIFNVAMLALLVTIWVNMSSVLGRAFVLLKIVETHAKLTDEQKDKIVDQLERGRTEAKSAATTAASVAKEVATEVRQAVEQVPIKVVEEIKKVTDIDSKDSSTRLKVINPEQIQPPQ